MTSDREPDTLEDRVRAHLRHRAEGITWDTLRPAQPPVPPPDAARFFPGWRRPVLRWVVPVAVGASTGLAALAWAVFAPSPGTTTDPAPVPPARIGPASADPTPMPPSTPEGTGITSPSPSLPASPPTDPLYPGEPSATSGYGPTAIPSVPPAAQPTPDPVTSPTMRT